ncbi:MAG: outer membrane protein assembly factor BamE [Pseudomonadota bacterium]
MRVIPASSPSFLRRYPHRAPLLVALACAALTLSGCAGRSILGEKPAAAQQGGVPVLPASGAQTTTVTPLQKFLWIFSPYRPVIQQGNFISEEMIAQLKVGMTRDQVRFVLGTPLLTDLFHADRWDYPFRLAKGNGEVTSSRVVVFFKDDKVARFEGGNLPTEKEYIARIAGPAPVIKGAPAKPEPAAAPAPVPAAPAAPAAAEPANPQPSK